MFLPFSTIKQLFHFRLPSKDSFCKENSKPNKVHQSKVILMQKVEGSCSKEKYEKWELYDNYFFIAQSLRPFAKKKGKYYGQTNKLT